MLVMLYTFVAKMRAISQDTVRVFVDFIFTGFKIHKGYFKVLFAFFVS